jgi:hypothetical protein
MQILYRKQDPGTNTVFWQKIRKLGVQKKFLLSFRNQKNSKTSEYRYQTNWTSQILFYTNMET